MPLSPAEAGAATALSRLWSIGPASLRKIFVYFGSFSAAFTATERDLLAAGLTPDKVADLVHRRDPRQVEADGHLLEQEGIRTILPDDPDFPRLLREIAMPPAFLHVRGALLADAVAIAIVGTRRASDYGLEMARTIAGGLARAGVVVVSGLALGIDGAAHEAVLDAFGTTWAFLGSGVDRLSIYPPSHRPLAERIKERGALLSEFPPQTAGFKHVFALRNRLIAGATVATVVVEAAERSGSLITAAAATDANREVFAVPGDATRDGSRGTLALIRRGAEPVVSAEDVLRSLGLDTPATVRANGRLAPEAERLLMLLGREPQSADELARASATPVIEVGRILSLLELAGRIRERAGGAWVRVS